MSKKRGLSADEKRDRLKELLVESKDVFTLKQLETIAPKQKGIVAQTVKDVLQSLVDDSLVKSDKIGTSNYFWCFPSDELNTRKNKIEKLSTEISTLKRKREELTDQLKEVKKGREETDERKAKLAKLDQLVKENREYKEKMRALADNNPELVNAMKRDTEKAKEAANRWTDNIFSLKSFCTSKFGVGGDDFSKNFGLPEDFDYVS